MNIPVLITKIKRKENILSQKKNILYEQTGTNNEKGQKYFDFSPQI